DATQVVLAADGALDEGDVDLVRKLLGIDERAVDEVGALADLQESFVQVGRRHGAARAAVEPDGGEVRPASFGHCPGGSSTNRRRGRNGRDGFASATDLP